MRSIKHELRRATELQLEPIMASLNLKTWIMYQFRVLLMSYFLFRIGVREFAELTITIDKGDGVKASKETRIQRALLTDMSAHVQLFDLLFVLMLMLNYRPRKWPSMFTIGNNNVLARNNDLEDESIVLARLDRIYLPLFARQGINEIELKDLKTEQGLGRLR